MLFRDLVTVLSQPSGGQPRGAPLLHREFRIGVHVPVNAFQLIQQRSGRTRQDGNSIVCGHDTTPLGRDVRSDFEDCHSLALEAGPGLIRPNEQLLGNPKCVLGRQHIRTFDEGQKIKDIGAFLLGTRRSGNAVSTHGPASERPRQRQLPGRYAAKPNSLPGADPYPLLRQQFYSVPTDPGKAMQPAKSAPLFVGLAMIESIAIYLLVISMILIFANPFWNR